MQRNRGPDPVVVTLGTDEFIRRFLIHHLPSEFHRIRRYGSLAGGIHQFSLTHTRDLRVAALLSEDRPVGKASDVQKLNSP
ncbi:transposase [Acidisoma silvae]|uniref:transposase n=1 Tax=Acidisoma silvae TaxID=2802396 RepID=UPI001D0A587C|nr:transposase [Acidisoma silvae]